MGSMSAPVGAQGQQLAQTIKEGKVAQAKRQDGFAGVVKEELVQTMARTENLVEGMRQEMSQSQNEAAKKPSEELDQLMPEVSDARKASEKQLYKE